MYYIIFTQGNNEKIIAEYSTKEAVKIAEKEYNKKPEYATGVISAEEWKDGKKRIL